MVSQKIGNADLREVLAGQQSERNSYARRQLDVAEERRSRSESPDRPVQRAGGEELQRMCSTRHGWSVCRCACTPRRLNVRVDPARVAHEFDEGAACSERVAVRLDRA